MFHLINSLLSALVAWRLELTSTAPVHELIPAEGFQSLVDAAIAMDADGYDITDDAGNCNYTEHYGMECSNPNVAFDEAASFSGLAKDGFPIYGAYDSVESVNTLPDPTTMDPRT